MGDGFIRWYREAGAESVFSDQVTAFNQHGVTLEHPTTKVATVVNVDGDDVPVDFDVLDQLVGLRLPSISINWWITADVNVVDSYACEPLGCEVQTFWVDGLRLEQIKAFSSAVMSTVSRVSTPTRALVCDYRGITDADDWDSVVLYGGVEIPGYVDLLLLGEEPSQRILSNSTRLRGAVAGDSLTRVTAT
ncbi:hypothetical protein AB0C59_07700 [Streptomyces sp. NPDC048664]|uniref:hypothetical protein n=1 Tax=Streptomyces sp. NPDC048664 TaxID=3154505 RepID=UPI00343437B7